MRWLVGWNGASAADDEPGLRELRPLGGRLLWPGPDPLWAVGDWRSEEIRTVTVFRQHHQADDRVHRGFPDLPDDPDEPAADGAVARMAVVGRCGAVDRELRGALLAASGGALRHLTSWPGSYTVVIQQGARTTVLGDLAGVHAVFHTPWCGGTAYATAALPLADLVGAPVDPLYLAARLALPDTPEALGDGSAFMGVRRVPPAHALSIRSGAPQLSVYEPVPGSIGSASPVSEAAATGGVTRSLLAAVRCRVRSEPGVPPTPGRSISTDLSGGSASSVVTLLAAGVPGRLGSAAPDPDRGRTLSPGLTPAPNPLRDPLQDPLRDPTPTPPQGVPVQSIEERWGDPRSYRTLHHGPPVAGAEPRTTGAVRGSWVRRTDPAEEPSDAPDDRLLLTITYTDTQEASQEPPAPSRTAELMRALTMAAADPGLRHRVVPGGPGALPYADLLDDPLAGPLTDEPGPALVAALRQRSRMADAGTDHLSGHGGRQVLDGHPARLADLLFERRRLPLMRPVAALARADSSGHPVQGTLGTPVAVLRAARRLARTPYADGLEDAAVALMARRAPRPDSAGGASVDALAWCAPGPAVSWLTDDALSAVAVRLRLAARRSAPDERPGARRARLALHRHAAEFRVLTQVVEEAHGQRLHAPFLDNQVVRACRLVPDSARIQPGARHEILRTVLTGAGVADIPADWGHGAPPDPYAAVESVRSGLRRAAGALDRLFAAPLLADLGLLEPDVFRAALHRACGGAAVPLDGLADIVSTELWLRRLRARRGSCWTGMPLRERLPLAAARPAPLAYPAAAPAAVPAPYPRRVTAPPWFPAPAQVPPPPVIPTAVTLPARPGPPSADPADPAEDPAAYPASGAPASAADPAADPIGVP
jgi:Asparagine synthase